MITEHYVKEWEQLNTSYSHSSRLPLLQLPFSSSTNWALKCLFCARTSTSTTKCIGRKEGDVNVRKEKVKILHKMAWEM